MSTAQVRGVFRTRSGKFVERMVWARLDHLAVDALVSLQVELGDLLFAYRGGRCIFNG